MLKQFKRFIILFFLLAQSIQISAQVQTTAKDFFDKGLQLMKEKKFNESLDAFRQSARLDKTQPATQANIGAVLMALNRIDESIAPFREAARLAPAEAPFRLALCQSLSLTGNHAEAISQCEEGVRLKGDAPDAHIALIAALQTAKRRGDALGKAENALQKFAGNEILLGISADANEVAGNYSRSLEIYETLARLRPGSGVYQVKLAENYLRFERDAEAVAAARKAIELEPRYSPAHFYLGKIYFELGQNEEASASFQKSAELDAEFTDALYFQGLSEGRRGKTENAIAALRKAVALAPENFEYQKELGTALNNDARYEEAVAPLKKAVALKPSDFEARVGLGLALLESARFGEALPVLEEADRMKPGNQIVNMFLNVARSRQQAMVRIDEMKAFARENPNDLDVRMHLIQLLTFGRRTSEAAPYIEEVGRMNSKDARVYYTLGTIHATAGNYEKAAEAYRKSLEIEPNNPTAFLGFASIYAKKGNIEEAIKAYEKVLELKPDSPNIMKLYADLLRDNGRRREALTMYQRSLRMLPTNTPALFNAGILSAKLGDLNAARQYLETLKSVDALLAKMLARFLKLQR
jgi:tetratricopeptide (TPR) repeat protein